MRGIHAASFLARVVWRARDLSAVVSTIDLDLTASWITPPRLPHPRPRPDRIGSNMLSLTPLRNVQLPVALAVRVERRVVLLRCCYKRPTVTTAGLDGTFANFASYVTVARDGR